MKTKPTLMAKDVALMIDRKLILSTLRGRVNSQTTIGELDALKHAEECIHNPAIFLSIVEPWYAAMLARESTAGRNQ